MFSNGCANGVRLMPYAENLRESGRFEIFVIFLIFEILKEATFNSGHITTIPQRW